MSSIDSIYNKIIADIEKNLPIPIKRPSRTRRVSASAQKNTSTEKADFDATLKNVAGTLLSPVTTQNIDMRSVMGRIEQAITNAAKRYNIDYELIKGVIKAESDFDPTCVSSAGAMGLMQLMPSNVKEYGISDPFNIEQNIDAGTRHLRDMINRYNGDLTLGLAAYNAGPGNVEKYGGIPPFKETQNYVPKVLKNMEEYKKG